MTSKSRGSKGAGEGKSGKRVRDYYLLVSLGLFSLAALGLLQLQSTARAAQGTHHSASVDQHTFLSATALSEDEPGTPVGPPKKVIICHNGHTIRVSSKALQAHLDHGDTLGPCPNDVVICHKYINFDNPEHTHIPYRTIIVNQKNLASYLALGDTLGPCPNQAFMCTKKNKIIVVASGNINDHLALGQTLGLCPGKNLMCHKGKTIIVDDADVQGHLAAGDCLGYCYGSAGPLIGQTSICTSNPPTSLMTR
jgi:hypothetical protein